MKISFFFMKISRQFPYKLVWFLKLKLFLATLNFFLRGTQFGKCCSSLNVTLLERESKERNVEICCWPVLELFNRFWTILKIFLGARCAIWRKKTNICNREPWPKLEYKYLKESSSFPVKWFEKISEKCWKADLTSCLKKLVCRAVFTMIWGFL
jgi:hypothetical protein